MLSSHKIYLGKILLDNHIITQQQSPFFSKQELNIERYFLVSRRQLSNGR